MTNEQKAAYIIGESAVLMAHIAGMMSENMRCQQQSLPMTYGEQDFILAVDQSPVHHNASIGLFNS